jgi:hypothetical protein
MKSFIFRDKTSFNPLKDNRYFGGICRFHLQGRKISQIGNQNEAGIKQSMFIRNVGCLSTEYMTLYHATKNSAHNLFLAKIPSDLKILIPTD